MFRDTSITLAARIASVLLTATAAMLTARFLGPSGRGFYSLFTTYLGILTLLGSLGIGTGNVYYASQRRYRASVLAWNSIFSALVLGGSLILAGRLAAGVVPELFGAAPLRGLWAALMAIPAILGSQFLSSLILGLQKAAVYSLLGLVQSGTLVAGLALTLSSAPRIEGAITAYTASYVLQMAAAFVYLVGAGIIEGDPRVDIVAMRRVAGFGIKLQVGNVLQFLSYRSSLFLVNHWLGPTFVGVYSIALFFAESLWLVTNSAATVVLPRVSGSPDNSEGSEVTTRASRFGFLVTVAVGLAMALMGRRITYILFGHEFTDAFSALLWLLPGTIAFSVTNVLASYITGRGFPHINTYIAAVTLTLNVAGSLVAIPIWGLPGVAAAASLSYVVATTLTVAFYRKLAGESLGKLLIPKLDDFKMITAAYPRRRARLARALSNSPRRVEPEQP